MSYMKRQLTRPTLVIPAVGVLLLLAAAGGCAGTRPPPAPAPILVAPPAMVEPAPAVTVTENGEPDQAPLSGARAFLDEAAAQIAEAQHYLDAADSRNAEFHLKEALQVLLEADRLIPSRAWLESELAASEAETVLREARLRLRGEFESLWTRTNALYDRLLPDLELDASELAQVQAEDIVDLAAMNAAMEESLEPPPGSWQEIRDLLLQMEEEGRIGLELGLHDYPDAAWQRIWRSLAYYTGRGRSSFRVWLERSGRYQKMVEDVLEREGLPRDMVFLCMIESGFSHRAFSRATATGPWQFMSYTARKYGLKTRFTDSFLDERHDFEKATVAAAGYLKDLYAEFGAWPLAMAGYNSGEGRVRSAQRYNQSRKRPTDYWSIYGRLPRETVNYVPYYLAALTISKNPARFGFADVAYQPSFRESYQIVHLTGPVLLQQVAELIGTTSSVLRELNPELHREITPTEGYDLRLPTGTIDTFITAFEQLPAEGRKSFEQYLVRSGDNGTVIARRTGVAWSEIKAENRITDDRRLQPGQALRIPKQEPSRFLTQAEIASLTARSSVTGNGTPLRYTVRRGDTISGLATRFGVTWIQIRQWNNLGGNTIYAGQTLTLYPRTMRVVTAPAVAAADRPSDGVYTVGRNDTLWDIAQKFGISVTDLKHWNGLNGNTIYPGNRLIVTREAAEAANVGGGPGLPGGH
jgi:membrane-bound lytic murein transglycosylase D